MNISSKLYKNNPGVRFFLFLKKAEIRAPLIIRDAFPETGRQEFHR